VKTDTWWVGIHGTILRDDGQALRAFPSPTSKNLLAIGGSSANDIWVAGQDLVHHWDGKAWSAAIDLTSVKKPNNVSSIYTEIVVTAPGDVWLRDYERIVRITPQGAISAMPIQGLRLLSATPSGTPWIWSNQKYQRWNKATSAFEAVPAAPGAATDYPRRMWFSGENDGYAATGSQLVHWDGATWTRVILPPTTPATSFGAIAAIGGSGPNDVWTYSYDGLFHFDGATWTKTLKAEEMTSLEKTIFSPLPHGVANFQANAPNDIWFGGTGGRPFHYDGTKWSRSTGIKVANLEHVLVLSPTDIWIGSGGTASHFDGTSWESFSSSNFEARPGSISSAVSVAPNAAWVVESHGPVKRWDGSKWTVVPNITGSFVWASSTDDVWVASKESTTAKHFNGTTWEDVTLPTKPVVLWGSAKDNVWVAGTSGIGETNPHFAWRWNGTSWSTEPAQAEHPIRAFAGTGPDDVYALVENSNGFVKKLDPAALRFRPLYSGGSNDKAIWSRGKNDLWVVGGTGNVSRYNGTTWEHFDSAAGVALLGVGGTATDGPFLVGQNGAVLKKR